MFSFPFLPFLSVLIGTGTVEDDLTLIRCDSRRLERLPDSDLQFSIPTGIRE